MHSGRFKQKYVPEIQYLSFNNLQFFKKECKYRKKIKGEIKNYFALCGF